MKQNILKYIVLPALLLVTIGGFYSCNYLEAEEYLHEVDELNDIWKSRKDIRAAWAACYGHIPNYSDINTSWPFSGGGDEGHGGLDNYSCLLLAQGKYNADNIPGHLNYWGKVYRAVRVCNQFLENSGQADDELLFEGEVESYQYDVRFLRAFYYATLLELYGPFVIVDKTVDYSSTDLPTTRATYDECVQWIVSELDQVIEVLPTKADVLKSERGRPTKGAAMALKSRVFLVAASPLVNGNNEYSSFVNKEGAPLINQTYDAEKWIKAADAAKAIIDLGSYQLLTVPANDDYTTVALGDFDGSTELWPNGPGGIDPYRSFKALFAGGDYYWNDEVLFQVNRGGQQVNLTRLGWPRGHKASTASQVGKVCATQEMVDAFYMNNGKTITEEDRQLYNDFGVATVSDGYYVLGDQSLTTSPIVTNYIAGNGVPIPPARCLNREPRFYATIGFQGRGYMQDDDAKPYYFPDYRAETADGYIQTDRPSVRTGYPIVKFINDEEIKSEGSFEKPWAVFRLAEIYLNYAEALNEYNPGDADILKYLNLVRFRGGMPGVTSGSQDEIRALIKRERFIELAFEGKRYFDVRRWKDAENTQRDEWGNTHGAGGSVTGCDFTKTDGDFYDRTVIDGYSFKKKHYFFPIPYGEVANHWGELVQNPGW